MARKMDSAITLAISSIALKTFLWQELMLLQQVLKEFFQNSFGKWFYGCDYSPVLKLGQGT